MDKRWPVKPVETSGTLHTPSKLQIICCPHIPIHGRASEAEAEAKNLIGSLDSSARCRLCQGSCYRSIPTMKQCCPLLSREPLTSECCRTFSCKQLDLPCYKVDLFCIRSSRCHDACMRYRYRPTACDIGPPWKDRTEQTSLLSNSIRTTSPKSESVLLDPSY